MLVKVQSLGSIELFSSSNDLAQMYRRGIPSNLERKRGQYRVRCLDGAWNAKDMKARCRNAIANTEVRIAMASGMRSIKREILKICGGLR